MTLIIYCCAIFGITASCFTNFMGTARIVQSFGRDGLLPEYFAECSPTTGIPVKACFVICIVLSTLAFFRDFEELSLLISLGNLLVFSFVSCCGMALRYKTEEVYENNKFALNRG